MKYQDLYETFRFVVVVLSLKERPRLILALAWLRSILKFYCERKIFMVGCPENVFRGAFPVASETLFVGWPAEGKWTTVRFSSGDKIYRRILKIVHSPYVKSRYCILSELTLFNIKNSLKLDPRFIRFGQSFRFRFEETHENFFHKEATKVVVSFFNDSYQLSQSYINETLQNFVHSPKFLKKDDIAAIDLSVYGAYHKQGTVYFKVIKIECEGEETEEVSALTESTSVFSEGTSKGYIPSSEWELIENEKISISPILPLGLTQYYNQILKWFMPFFSSANDLTPVFILSGSRGSGKSVTLQAACKKLGVGFNKLDCSNLLASTQTQINANIKTVMRNLTNYAPCVLELYNSQLLSVDIDGIDSEQIFKSFSQIIKSLRSDYPFVVVMSCEDISELKQNFVNLSLQQMVIAPLSEDERRLTLTWLTQRHNIHLTDEIQNYLTLQTSSFSTSDLQKLLCLSEKERIKTNSQTINVDHLKKILDQMSVVSKGDVKSVDWQDVGGIEAIKKEVLGSLLSSQLMSVKRTGLLLHGPPGTGKTLLARAVASQCGRAFISVKGPELLNMYVGQSEANIRQVFSRAKEASPCIIFFDELDSLAPNRGNKSDSGGVMDRVVSQLLTEMDELDNEGDIFILGATNRPDLIDPALLRPGRFDKMIYVGPCEDHESKIKVMTALIRNFNLEEIKLESIVSQFPEKVTGANLYAICSSAWMNAAKELINNGDTGPETKVIVKQEHFEKAISEVNMTF